MKEKDIDTELFQNMRYYGEMRFKQLILLLAWLTIAGTGIAQNGNEEVLDGASLKLIIALASMLVTGIIWIMEISSTKYWVAHRSKQNSKWPGSKRVWKQFSATNATVFFYFVCYIFWLYASYEWQVSILFGICFTIILIVLVVYTVLNYLPIWMSNSIK